MQEPELNDVTPANLSPYAKLSDLKDGESISGILLKKAVSERFNSKFYYIFTNDNHLIQLSGTYKLNNFMEVIDEDSYVKIIVLGRKEISTGTLIEVDVKVGSDSAWVQERRKLGHDAMTEAAAENKGDAPAEGTESLESIFGAQEMPL